MTEINAKLRQLRNSYGYSLDYVAKSLGTSQQHISDIEVGKTKVTMDLLEDLAKFYKMSVVDIIQFGDKNTQNNHNQSGGTASIYFIQQIPSEITEILSNIGAVLKGMQKNGENS
jgi:transcriptional regulator with XRE-family HTH domain